MGSAENVLMTVGRESSISELRSIGYMEKSELSYSKLNSSRRYFPASLDMYGYAVVGRAGQVLQLASCAGEHVPPDAA